MNVGKTIFAQLLEYLPLYEFQKCVKRYRGNYKIKRFTCLGQFITMAFAQLTFRESLRDIESCLWALKPKLYHIGIKSRVCRNTLAHANEKRDWRIYADFAQVLIQIARPLYAQEEFGVDLKELVYAFDSTTIDLCLSLFPWAHFKKTKAAVKLHTLLDLRGNIPVFISITEGNVHDLTVLDVLPIEPGSYYLLDRGYIDYQRLYAIHTAQSFFITRAKSNTKTRRLYSMPADKQAGIVSDHVVVLANCYASRDYPEKLRRVHYCDKEQDKHLVFLTNNQKLPAQTIAKLFQRRWQIETFFKWIKQHLRIKGFYGTSDNAVKTQIWIAISIYVLVAIVKKRLGLEASLYSILQVLSITLFEKKPIHQAFSEIESQVQEPCFDNQLVLFE